MQAAVNMPKLADIGDVVAGKYRIDAVLGQGGMGAVFVGTHLITGKKFAIKMLLPHVARDEMVAQRFVQEAQASARIAHRNVVEVLDIGESGGALYLVMELLVGESLTAYVERNGAMPVADVMAIMTRVLRGLEAAHQNGIIHRDLKPDNIFLCADDKGDALEPKIVDFGIAKITDSSAARGTATGTGMGTAYYMPLEQMMGAKHVTFAADIYSIGVCMYECLSGRLPYEAETLPALVMAMHSGPPEDLRVRRPELPAGLSAAVMRALATQAADRPQSVAELVDSMREFGLGDGSLPVPRPKVSKLASPTGPSTGKTSGEVLASMSAAGHASAPTMHAGSVPQESAIRVKAGAESAPTMAPPPSKSSLIVPILAGVGIAAIIGGGVIFALTSRTQPAPTVVAPPAPIVVAAPPTPPPVAPQAITRVTVRTGDREARLTLNGLELGATPIDVELQGTPPSRTFELASNGIDTLSWTVRLREDGSLEAICGEIHRLLAVSSDHHATLDVDLVSDARASHHARPVEAPAAAPVAAAPPPPAPVAAPEPPPPPRRVAPALAPR